MEQRVHAATIGASHPAPTDAHHPTEWKYCTVYGGDGANSDRAGKATSATATYSGDAAAPTTNAAKQTTTPAIKCGRGDAQSQHHPPTQDRGGVIVRYQLQQVVAAPSPEEAARTR